MNTIFTIFCQLALLYAYCAPVSGVILDPAWSLEEATISSTEEVHRENYTNEVSLILNENFYEYYSYNIFADANNDGSVVDVFRIKLGEFNSFVDDTAFFILTDGSDRVVRLKFAEKSEAQRFVAQVFAVTHVQREYDLTNAFKIVKLGKRLQDSKISVFVGLDENDDEAAQKRQFIIYGGVEDRLFVVFNPDEFDIMRGTRPNRFVLVVKSPGDFEEIAYYGLVLSMVDDSHENFEECIKDDLSSNKIVPETLYSFADYL